jgi:NAD(P)H dehydrogenase (quinone)
MFAILGAAGHVGFSTASALREAGAPVRAVLRNDAKAAKLKEIGCELAFADLQDAHALAEAIDGADAVQVIAPLRPQTADPAKDLLTSVANIIEALKSARPRTALAISDYGAHVSEDIGMPSIFHAFEAELRQLGGQRIILRSAEHMYNWARGLPKALETGALPSFQIPVDMAQPTIASQDLGRIAAEILLAADGNEGVEIVHAEGPHRYSASDVAAAVSRISGREIHAQPVPREAWQGAFAQMPPSLADLLTKANDAKNKGGLVDVEPGVGPVRRGTTELAEALRPLLASA